MFRKAAHVFILLLSTFLSQAQTNAPLVVLTADQDLISTYHHALEIGKVGARVNIIAAPGCIILRANNHVHNDLIRDEDIRVLHGAEVTASMIRSAPSHHEAALQWLYDLHSGNLDARSALSMAWPDHTHGDALLRDDHHLRAHTGTAPPDWTCTDRYNSERMVGTVVASTFFVESDGSIDPDEFTWNAADLNSVKSQILDAWSVWTYTASQYGSSVIAIMDWYEPASGVTHQGYEPIRHPSYEDQLWTNAIMQNLGYTQSGQFNKLDAFNTDQRNAFDAENAFSCFVAYNPPSAGAPDAMTDGRIGYAYLGGPYTQILFKANGWSTTQVNRVYGHEVGHIFHAFDEYASSPQSNCTRSFNGEPNSNYQGSTCNGSHNCVMIDNSLQGSGASRQWHMCTHTPYHLGWNGTVAPASLNAPVNMTVVNNSPVTFYWDRNGAPTSVIGHLKVFDRNTGNEVYCNNVGMLTQWDVLLLNGDYDWLIGLGATGDANGYAGVLSTTGQFTLNAPLHADFSVYPSTVCIGEPVYFTDASTGDPATWNWSFPGGMPNAHNGMQPPAITYALPGSYDVTLTVGDGNGTDSRTMIGAVMVTGGLVLDHMQDFNGGIFPPTGWTANGQGAGGNGTFTWEADPLAACSQGVSAYADGFNYGGQFGLAILGSPQFDLTAAIAPYLSFKVSHAAAAPGIMEQLTVLGQHCGTGGSEVLYSKGGLELATNGGAYQSAPRWVPQDCNDQRTEIIPLDAVSGSVVAFQFNLTTGGGQVVYLDDVQVYEGIPLNLRVLLDGPFNAGSGLMNDDLRQNGLLPLLEPYGQLGYDHTGEGGMLHLNADLNTTGPNAIVDWLLVEIRSAQDATRILTSRAVLLQRDGDVVDMDGMSQPYMGVVPGIYHVAVKHRSHLGIMTGTPVQLGPSSGLLDLTDWAVGTWGGSSARTLHDGVALMWAGDATFDQQVQYTGAGNDRDPLLSAIGGSVPSNVVSGYYSEDINMDGQVRYTGAGNDRDIILQTIGGNYPNVIRYGQLP